MTPEMEETAHSSVIRRQRLMAILRSRPCTFSELMDSIGMPRKTLARWLKILEANGEIRKTKGRWVTTRVNKIFTSRETYEIYREHCKMIVYDGLSGVLASLLAPQYDERLTGSAYGDEVKVSGNPIKKSMLTEMDEVPAEMESTFMPSMRFVPILQFVFPHGDVILDTESRVHITNVKPQEEQTYLGRARFAEQHLRLGYPEIYELLTGLKGLNRESEEFLNGCQDLLGKFTVLRAKVDGGGVIDGDCEVCPQLSQFLFNDGDHGATTTSTAGHQGEFGAGLQA